MIIADRWGYLRRPDRLTQCGLPREGSLSTLLLRITRAIAAAHKGMERYTMYLSIPLSLKDGCAGTQRVSHYIADPTCEMPLVSASSSA